MYAVDVQSRDVAWSGWVMLEARLGNGKFCWGVGG